jgi:hypothetical protein
VAQVDGVKFPSNGTGIAAAITSLPSCTIPTFGQTWDHCGTVYIPSGTYTVASQISVDSPMVHVKGAGSESTYLNFIGKTGCAFDWTAAAFNTGGEDSDELEDLTIDGSASSAGTCGVHYYDIIAFTMNRVDIRFFKGAGSSALWTDAKTQFTERGKVQAQLYDNTIGWHITNNVHSASGPVTVGYANYDLWINCNNGQTCIRQENGTNAGIGSFPYLTYSNLHIVINGGATGIITGVSLQNGVWSWNNYNIHMEGISTGFNIANGMSVDGIGSISEDPGVTNTLGANTFLMSATPRRDPVNGTNNLALGFTNFCDATSASYSVTVCGRAGVPPFQIDYNGDHVVQVAADGSLSTGGSLSSSAVKLAGSSSGFIEHVAPSEAGSNTITDPAATGTTSLAAVEYCGATTGVTQNCAKTVQTLPIIVWGDVLLNSGTSQSITALPFTDALYSCSGSDLTIASGIVSFKNYASSSVTIAESGGANTDHLRYMCVGH